MKENCEHYIETLGYLMEQTLIYFRESGTRLFNQLNFEITLEQLIAMDTISLNPGICQMDLARLILKERSYTSRILDSIEKSGFIKRKISKKNNRLVNKLYITPKGENILVQVGEKAKNLHDEIYKDMSQEEFEIVRNGILKMKACVSKFMNISV